MHEDIPPKPTAWTLSATSADYLLEIEKFAKKLEGKEIIYKNHILATVAGYQGSWIILGFNDLSGCIKEFSPHIKYVRGFTLSVC